MKCEVDLNVLLQDIINTLVETLASTGVPYPSAPDWGFAARQQTANQLVLFRALAKRLNEQADELENSNHRGEPPPAIV